MPTVSMGTNGSIITADRVAYDNATSGLEAENVQDAVDEVLMFSNTVTPVEATFDTEYIAFNWLVKCGRLVVGKVITKEKATTQLQEIGTLTNPKDFPMTEATSINLVPSNTSTTWLNITPEGKLIARGANSIGLGATTWMYCYLSQG